MTIPVSPVHINPQFIPNQQTPGMELLVRALEQRRELDLKKQKIQQEREQFELNKRLIGTEIEGAELLNAKRKKELKDAEDDLLAQDQAYQLWVGNLPRAGDMRQWGEVIAGVKDKRVAGHLMGYVEDFFKAGAQQATATGTELRNDGMRRDLDEDTQIQDVLGRFSQRSWNRNTIRQAIGQVVAINPQKAGQVASALNALLPDYQIQVNDDGTVAYIPRSPGETVGEVQPRRPTDEQNKVANYAVRVLEANATMTDLERRFPGIGQRVDGIIRTVRSIEQYPVVGRALATQALKAAIASMSPGERLYFNSRTDVGNALLRRASGAQINMEELDRETVAYAPIANEDEAVVLSKQQRRLQQGLLFAQQAGAAFRPNSLTPEARRYLLSGFVGANNPAPQRQRRAENPYQ